MLSEASELVAVNARSIDGVLRFGDGLLVGLPLRAGWRKKLYVCPHSGRLQRIPDSGTNTAS